VDIIMEEDVIMVCDLFKRVSARWKGGYHQPTPFTTLLVLCLLGLLPGLAAG